MSDSDFDLDPDDSFEDLENTEKEGEIDDDGALGRF